MNIAELDNWITSSGLTAKEVATIQPAKGNYTFRSNHILIGEGKSTRSFQTGYPSIDFGYQNSVIIKAFSAMARYESLGPKDYYAGLRLGYVRSIGDTRNSVGFGLTPGLFKDNASWGMNFKPDIAYSILSKPFWRFSLQMMLSYGYDFALSNADAFPVSRQDVSVRAFLH